ncbi:hypothetical protein R1flu_007631 [Riccia fluitans]|uniref:DUF7054 domain-containing protein n=1 Tax=Riccia fluitans TaxID=41844 RepID=A0ABD1YZE8_9MARC
MTTSNLNAAAVMFKSGVLESERQMKAAGDKRAHMTLVRQQSLERPLHVQVSGKKFLRALSSFSCISSKSMSTVNNSASSRREEQRSLDLKDGSLAFQEKSKRDQKILLRIMMWGGPNTLLLLAPFDAPTERVIEMVLDSYVSRAGPHDCHDYELFCAHCNSPALQRKQQIGNVGSRHFLLCKKGPGVVRPDFLTNISHVGTNLHSTDAHHKPRHARSQSHSGSTALSSLSHSLSLAQLNSSVSTSNHRRSQSWWNPASCLSIGGHH